LISLASRFFSIHLLILKNS